LVFAFSSYQPLSLGWKGTLFLSNPQKILGPLFFFFPFPISTGFFFGPFLYCSKYGLVSLLDQSISRGDFCPFFFFQTPHILFFLSLVPPCPVAPFLFFSQFPSHSGLFARGPTQAPLIRPPGQRLLFGAFFLPVKTRCHREPLVGSPFFPPLPPTALLVASEKPPSVPFDCTPQSLTFFPSLLAIFFSDLRPPLPCHPFLRFLVLRYRSPPDNFP